MKSEWKQIENKTFTKVWSISELLSSSERNEIIASFLTNSSNNFDKAKVGAKLSIEHKSSNADSMVELSSVQRLMRKVISESFLNNLSMALIKTDSYWAKDIQMNKKLLKPLSIGKFVSSPNRTYLPHPWRISLKELSLDNIRGLRESFEKAYNCVCFIPRMQFSLMNHSTFIPPHTDISNKIATIMLYLPINESQRNSMLGTTFWNPKNDKNTYGQVESKFLTNEQQLVFKNDYLPTRTSFQQEDAILFFRTNNSWHSFEYDTVDLGPRLSININLLYPTGPGV